jgi:hypothetical protein
MGGNVITKVAKSAKSAAKKIKHEAKKAADAAKRAAAKAAKAAEKAANEAAKAAEEAAKATAKAAKMAAEAIEKAAEEAAKFLTTPLSTFKIPNVGTGKIWLGVYQLHLNKATVESMDVGLADITAIVGLMCKIEPLLLPEAPVILAFLGVSNLVIQKMAKMSKTGTVKLNGTFTGGIVPCPG